ncbi:MAG: ADOP family duplicated permease [Terriglobales bacterium]
MADDRRLREELATHREQLRAEFERQGLSPQAAGRAARLKLGGEDQIRMLWRDARRWSWLERWGGDVRLALRALRRSPGYAAAVVITLALAIAANTAMFSLVYAFLLRPLPYAQAQQLVMIHGVQSHGFHSPISYPLFLEWRDHNHSLIGMAAYTLTDGVLTGSGGAEHVQGAAVSANFFSLLGVLPARGRFFLPAEDHPFADHGADAMVISHALFERRFGGRASVLGRIVQLSGKVYTIVGVAPPGFAFYGVASSDYWITAAAWFEPRAGQKQPVGEDRNTSFLWANIGRLRPGVSVAQATRDFDRIASQRRGRRAISDVDANAWIAPFRQATLSSITELLHLLWASAGLVLLIACANLAGLGLARGMAQLPALRVRVALGARPWDLLRVRLCESTALAVAGCVAGFALALPAVSTLKTRAAVAGFVPQLSGPVLAYTAALGAAAALLIGCWPAWAAMHGAVGPRARAAQRGRSLLVAAQVAVALVLVAAACLLARSLYGLVSQNPGFDPNQVLTARLTLPDALPPARRPEVFQAFLGRLQSLPGVAAASAGGELPWGQTSFRTVLGAMPPHRFVNFELVPVTPEFFRTLRIPLLRGRAFTNADSAGAPAVVIVNRRFVQKLRAVLPSFPADPLGAAVTPEVPHTMPRTIIGVVANVVTPGEPPRARLYLPYLQAASRSSLFIAVRAASGDPMALLPSVRHQLVQVGPDLALGGAQLLSANRADWAAPPEAAATVAAAFGLLALLLAATGLYGLMAYAVRQREHELGIRVALGAQRRDIYRLILGMGVRLTVVGLVAGGVGVYLVRGLLASQLYGFSALDPATFAGAVLVLLAAASAAAYGPARRAAHADPLRALRTE